jgi:hypothetical protein
VQRGAELAATQERIAAAIKAGQSPKTEDLRQDLFAVFFFLLFFSYYVVSSYFLIGHHPH